MNAKCLSWSMRFLLVALVMFATVGTTQAGSYRNVIRKVQPKMVKIYGAGGLRGLEAYQSGFLISDKGHVLTVWSYVLDSEIITVTLDDGRKFQAELLGADPRLEVAVLKIEIADLEYFNLDETVEVDTGSRILAFSNLYGVAAGNEPHSVLHGSVAVRTTLDARRGAFKTPYEGPVYVLDAMTNNPGAAGGALTDRQGRLTGLLGKELRNSQTNTWLNYSIPIEELAESIADIIAGRARPRASDERAKKAEEPLTLDLLGIVLVPDVLQKTPPFVDGVRLDSPAERKGIKTDDLVLFVEGRIIQSVTALKAELELIDREEEVRLTVQRGEKLVDVVISTFD